jgi:hypothetical protein
MGTLPDFKQLILPYHSQSFRFDHDYLWDYFIVSPQSLNTTACWVFVRRLKAKRLGEGGTQTFDDHKYITGNPQMQGLDY